MKKAKSQSSQQTTLTSFFSTKPKDKITPISSSQSSVDSGLVSDSSPFKTVTNVKDNTARSKHHKVTTDIKNLKTDLSLNKLKKSFANSLSPSKSISKDIIVSDISPCKTFSNVKDNKAHLAHHKVTTDIKSFKKDLSPIKLKKSLSNNLSPSKSVSKDITYWLSPSKRSFRVENKDNGNISPSKINSLCSNQQIEIINLIDDTSPDKPVLDNEKSSLRRSPRKHPSSLSNLIELKQSKSNIVKSNVVRNLLDETDDSNFKAFESLNLKKKRDDNLDEKFESFVKKRKISSSNSPKKLINEAFFSENELFDNDEFFTSNIVDIDSSANVDLSDGCRCKVSNSLLLSNGDLLLTLKEFLKDSETQCILQYPWNQLPVKVGDHVSIKANKSSNFCWKVSDNDKTWFVLHSDELISCTSVVGSLFCSRRSILNHIFKEIPSKTQASAMHVGIIVHQLLQQALKNKLYKKEEIEAMSEEVINSQDFIRTILLQGMDLKTMRENISLYLPRIVEFIQSYVSVNRKCKISSGKEWAGEITQINDIEENLWIPSLGLKGKIDATVQVKVNSSTKIMPLELKTGKVSNNAEHRGQVILYCMMLNQKGVDSTDSGLLLYLKNSVLKEVRGGDRERRDLIMLRNELASRIHSAYAKMEQDGLPALPTPIDWQSVCQKCPQLITCTSALRKSKDTSHPLYALVPEKTSHLSDNHLDYVFSWLQMISVEASQAKKFSPIWANTVDIRENEGSCVGDLKIVGEVKVTDFKVEVTLTRDKPIQEGVLQEGQYVIVSTDKQVALTTGHVQSVSDSHVTLLVEKDLSKVSALFHIDRYESNSSNGFLSNFLSILLDNSIKSDRLRRIIIDKELPKFAPKLSSKVMSNCEKVYKGINRDQVRTILQVLSADTYIIIKGMPGTGKSRTVAALIEVLTILGHSILLTSHTHSAVDNIMVKLPKTLHDRMIRLGKTKRVHASITHLTEKTLLDSNPNMTFEQMSSLYNSKTIVGVTCLGSQHPLIIQKEFDYCIVDEATQVCQPETLAALSASKKFILIGDPNQLPPLIISDKAKQFGMGISLLERLDRPAVSSSLTKQYRMNQTITSLANSFTYNNLLKCATDEVASATIQPSTKVGKDCPEWLRKACSPKLSDSVIVIDVKAKDQLNQNINNREADLIISIILKMKQMGLPETDIGVITPYRAQISLIEKQLGELNGKVEVSTVDQYQGRDKSVIFYGATRNKEMVPGVNDILGDKNRLTVAITRAKHKLIIIGNVHTLSSYPTFKQLFSAIDSSNFVQPNDEIL